MIYVGGKDELNDEHLALVQSLTASFATAYARYEDFVKLESANQKVEKTLEELKATQSQLIQQEKLASLGQLTAGIAHEIKNPLNFVNNFSDLSRELIEEVFVEMENLEASATKEEVIAILRDVQNNLTKVHEHGTRADGIVTSMLQHSRASGGKRLPIAFNPLVKEFVNLSFHGMRASKAPINVEIDLQLNDQVGDVLLISEDFSRVILNLCNNAFDAMRDKLKAAGMNKEGYMPRLTVITALQKDKVILSIADNGPGIPKEIQDKILQPFFTTKKGTEGTGLGLSITNDIIKAHGGELKVETKVADPGTSGKGEGTTFIVQIPTF
jgi:signal transduction histidine kinase